MLQCARAYHNFIYVACCYRGRRECVLFVFAYVGLGLRVHMCAILSGVGGGCIFNVIYLLNNLFLLLSVNTDIENVFFNEKTWHYTTTMHPIWLME